MKTLNFIVSLFILCSVTWLSGCANTLNGMQADWKQDTQKMSDSTNR